MICRTSGYNGDIGTCVESMSKVLSCPLGLSIGSVTTVRSRNRIRLAKILSQAEGYLELDMPQHALDALARLGDTANFSSHGLYLRGDALRGLERHHEALVALKQAVQRAPSAIHIWLAMGWCHKRTGDIDLAVDALEEALAVDPGSAIVHYNMACYLSLLDDKPRALAHLAEALAIDSGYRELIDDEPDFDRIRNDPDFQAIASLTA